MITKRGLNRWFITAISVLALGSCKKDVVYEFDPKEHSSIVIIGNTFAEQMQTNNYFETLLHKSFPARKLRVRNLGWSADEVNLQPRPLNFGGLDEYLLQEKADYIIACYGLNEAFKGKDSVDAFGLHLTNFLKNLQEHSYNGISNPQIILVSPIAHEEMGGLLPDPTEHNKKLALYTNRMRSVAKELGISFINLFDPTKELMNDNEDKLTYNGIHLNKKGYRQVSEIMANALSLPVSSYSTDASWEELRKVIEVKNQHYFYKYRAVNGEYIYGRRKKPYGIKSFPPEFKKLDRMVKTMDSVIWAGSKDHSNVDMKLVNTIINDTIQYKPYDPDHSFGKPSPDQFVIKEGYKIELFASEENFPIGNATSFTFDPKGRLWVSTLESFPQVLPGALPNDKLVILEDKNQDGKADDYVIFADSLYEPLGFELGDGGVYLSQPPNFVFLKDTNNDQRADVQIPLLHGFGTEDVHHTISAFTWGQDGALYMHEGTFLHSQVETPYGPVRGAYATTWRYEPYTQKLTPYISYPYSNPWGNVFMRNGMHLIGDASPGRNYYATPMTVATTYPYKHMWMDDFPTTRLRPTCGLEIISSRHFPEAVQGDMLQPNIVGFQGIKQYDIKRIGSGIIAHEVEPLLQSKDLNFRPVDLQMGPDGALYILDFYNPIVGHSTFSFRDPNRDHVHGRIWRVTYEGKETLPAVDLTQLNIPQLLDQLKEYEDRTRYRTRSQLREFPKEKVLQEVSAWLKKLDTQAEEYDQNRLEALWLYQQFHQVNDELLMQLLKSKNEDVRAAATRVLFYWKDQIPDTQERLIGMSKDPSQRVRLEAIVSLSHFNTEETMNALLGTLDLPTDYYMYYALNESFKQLRPVWMDMFRDNKNFLKDQPEKAFYVLNSVTSNSSLALPFFVKADPEKNKYSRKPFDQEDYNALSEVPAVVKFWISKKHVPDSIKFQGLTFLSELEGKSTEQLVNDRLSFLKKMRQEVSAFLNWKNLSHEDKSVHSQAKRVDGELQEDITALSRLLATNEADLVNTDSANRETESSDKTTIKIAALAGQMAFDKKEFTVKAGQSVEIIFSNNDGMQHNLLIIKPGTLNQVGQMAEEMAKEPNAFERNFIPDTKNVLFSTHLLDPGEIYTLTFTAPQTPGDYSFVCTFPGHWRIMNGIMKVIKN